MIILKRFCLRADVIDTWKTISQETIPLTAQILTILCILILISGCSPREYPIAYYETDVDGIQIIVTDVNECDVTRQITCYLKAKETQHGPFVVNYLECGRSFDKSKYELVSNESFIVFRRVGSRHAKLVFDKVGKIVLKLDDLPDGVHRLLEEGPVSVDRSKD